MSGIITLAFFISNCFIGIFHRYIQILLINQVLRLWGVLMTSQVRLKWPISDPSPRCTFSNHFIRNRCSLIRCSFEYYEIFNNSFFHRTPPVAAFALYQYLSKLSSGGSFCLLTAPFKIITLIHPSKRLEPSSPGIFLSYLDRNLLFTWNSVQSYFAMLQKVWKINQNGSYTDDDVTNYVETSAKLCKRLLK